MKYFVYVFIIGSLIGLLASFLLTVDTIKLIENPGVELPCNLNPFVSCTSVATAWQGQVFGFPNSLLGIVAFAMLLATGIMLFAGGRAHKLYWQLVNLGSLASMVFVVWFFYQSVYNIGSLCLYCMVVWAVTWPIFLYTTVWNYRENHLIEHPVLKFISKNHFALLVLVYLLMIMLIIFRFRDFFLY